MCSISEIFGRPILHGSIPNCSVCVCVKFHKLVGTQPSHFAKIFCYIVRSLEDTLKLSFVSISKFASVIQMLEPSRYKYNYAGVSFVLTM